MNINLGDRVKDVVTEFEGIVVSRIEYINGCVQFGVAPKATKGAMPDTQYIDHKRLKVIGKPVTFPKEDTGGVMFDAPRS
jgi:hypothetical protein